jgi:DNA polymerase III gamma/tau subunit
MTPALLFPDMAELPGFAFPEPLCEKYRPRTIADFAGLAETKKTLLGFVSNPRAIGLLFVGPAGTGKTSMGIALSRAIGGFIHHVKAGECSVDKVRELAFSCHYYPPPGFKFHVILVDEMDLASLPAQNAILSYLDGTSTIPQTIWVFTCNSTERLADRFLSRCRNLAFSTYGIQADATKLLERVWSAETDAPTPNMARLIKEQNGNIRAALSILDSKLDALKGAL